MYVTTRWGGRDAWDGHVVSAEEISRSEKRRLSWFFGRSRWEAVGDDFFHLSQQRLAGILL